MKKRNHFIKDKKQNELISKKQKNICKILSYTERLLILVSTVTGSVSIYGFASFVGIPVGIASSVVMIKTCIISAGVKKYESIIKKMKQKHDKIVLLAKVEVSVSKTFIDPGSSYDEPVSLIWKKKSKIRIINNYVCRAIITRRFYIHDENQ